MIEHIPLSIGDVKWASDIGATHYRWRLSRVVPYFFKIDDGGVYVLIDGEWVRIHNGKNIESWVERLGVVING